MKTRSWMFLFLISLCAPWVKGQTDSTDLNLYFTQPEMLSQSDSMTYLNGDYQEYTIQFDIDEPDSLGKLWIEFIRIHENSGASLLFHQSYTPTELSEQNLVDGDAVTLSFGFFYVGAIYQAAIRIEDLHGHEIRTITKTLVP